MSKTEEKIGWLRICGFINAPRFHVTAEFFSISSIKISNKMSYICIRVDSLTLCKATLFGGCFGPQPSV